MAAASKQLSKQALTSSRDDSCPIMDCLLLSIAVTRVSQNLKNPDPFINLDRTLKDVSVMAL